MAQGVEAPAAKDNTEGEAGADTSAGTLLGGNEDGSSGDEGGEGSGDGPAGAPEEYADFTIPEGQTLNGEVLDGFKAFAKENNLSQEVAQKLVDMGLKLVEGDPVAEADAAREEQWTESRAQWVKDLKEDPEFGGDNFGPNVQSAQRALREYGSPELTSYLESTGLGDYPELVKMFAKIDKAMGESKSKGGEGVKPPLSAGEALYPTMREA